jgi:hypothetical protein
MRDVDGEVTWKLIPTAYVSISTLLLASGFSYAGLFSQPTDCNIPGFSISRVIIFDLGAFILLFLESLSIKINRRCLPT